MSRNKIRSDRKISVTEALVSFVLCIITGCGFIAMHIHGIDAVNKDETTAVTGSFESYDYSAYKGTTHYICLSFLDIEKQFIDGSCSSDALFEEIDKLEKGTKLHMLVDEKNDIIMEIKTDDKILLSFDFAQSAIKDERTEFIILGIGFIIIGLCVLIYVKRREKIRL